jgi:hypothetical protein
LDAQVRFSKVEAFRCGGEESIDMEHTNCPILVGHLNKLSAGTEAQKALAFQLVMILDDVESIAALMDHESPADRHALARTQNIRECSGRLQNLIVAAVCNG